MSPWLWLLVISLQLDDAISGACNGVKIGHSEFTQLPDCKENYLLWYDTGVNSTNLLECARHCARTDGCLSFYYVRKPRPGYLSCGLGMMHLPPSCSHLDYYKGASFYLKPTANSACDQPWILALLQHGREVFSGNLSYLIERIEQGARVRIMAEATEAPQREITLSDVDSVWVINSTVTAQMFTWTWDNDKGKPVWIKLQANTLGLLVTTFYNHSVHESEAYIRWVIKETTVRCGLESPVLLDMYPDGQVVQGSVNDLMLAVVEGFPLQMVEKRGEDVLRSFPVSTASANSDGSLELHGVWLGGTPESPNQVVFTNEMVAVAISQSSASYLFIDIDVMDAESKKRRNGNDTRFLLAAEFCWEKIYVGTMNGNVEFGSKEKLYNKMFFGAELRVVYQCNGTSRALSIKRIGVEAGLVAYSTPSLTFRNGQTYAWEWVEVHSNGEVSVITHDLGDENQSKKSCRARISWFANSRKRDEVWFYHQKNEVNAEFFSTFDIGPIIKGFLPVIVEKVIGKEKWYSYRSQAVTLRQGDDKNRGYLVRAVNCRSFNGSYWVVIFHYSLHHRNQVGIDIITQPGSIGYDSNGFPYWSSWFL